MVEWFCQPSQEINDGKSQKHLMTSTKKVKGDNGPHAQYTREFGSCQTILPRQSRFPNIVSVIMA